VTKVIFHDHEGKPVNVDAKMACHHGSGHFSNIFRYACGLRAGLPPARPAMGHVSDEWIGKLKPKDDMEAELDFADDVQDNSRFAAKFPLPDDLDGTKSYSRKS